MQLAQLIESLKRRRMIFIALRGASILIAVAAALLFIIGLAAYKFDAGSLVIVFLRIFSLLTVSGVAWYYLIRPLTKKIADTQLARLVEERHEGLNERLVSAIEFSTNAEAHKFSPAILDKLKEDAEKHVGQVNLNNVYPRKQMQLFGGGAIAALMLFITALLFGPESIQQGILRVVTPNGLASASNKFDIKVMPGTAKVPKGTDQRITASLINFKNQSVTIFYRDASKKDDQWIGKPMEPAKRENDFLFFILNIQEHTEYYIESNGFKTETYKLTVVDLPYVKRIDQTQFAPSYTGIPPKTIEDAPDIAALSGTNIRITAKLSGRVKSAVIVIADGRRIPMHNAGESATDDFAGDIPVTKESTYHIELTSFDGETYNGSNEYNISILEDREPTVIFEKPGRDTKATSVEEVQLLAKAEDDYGVKSIDLFYSVNGGEERKVELMKIRGESAKTLSGAHTFFLEEFKLQPGDLISYYARAGDATRQATSDIYFIEIKPFEKDIKQGQASEGGGAGGQQQSLTRRQKEIIAATFRINKEEAFYKDVEKNENYNTVTISQEKLRDDTQTMIDRIKRRLGAAINQQSDFGKVIQHLEEAAKLMEPAATELKARKSKTAIPLEQKALQQLMRADAVFREMTVAMNNDSQGQSNSQAEELADLFELELDKMKNQYETLKREQQNQSQQQDDATKRKLEDLARRMQRELEQQGQNQQSPRNQSSGGGGSQRRQQQMIEEAQKAARELERLSRERRDPSLQEAANQMKQAAEEMQRAQNAEQNNKSQESQVRNNRAMQQLNEALRKVNRSQQSQGAQSVEDLKRSAEDAARQQREIGKEVEKLAGQQRSGKQPSEESKQNLADRKQNLADQLKNLEGNIDQIGRGMSQEQQKATDKLKEAVGSLRRNRVADKVESTKRMIEQNQFGAAQEGDKNIQQNIDQVAEQLQQAARDSQQRSPGNETEEALDRANRLADNLESMRRRMNGGRSQQSPQPGGGGRPGPIRGGQQDRAQSGNPANSANPNSANSESSRQSSSEMRQYLKDAEELKRSLASNRDLTKQLDNAIKVLSQMSNANVPDDTTTAALLKSQVIDPLRAIELELSKRLQAKLGKSNLRQADEGAPPERYKKLVDEYYKRLSAKPIRRQ